VPNGTRFLRCVAGKRFAMFRERPHI
jgi:hypothetical protein